MSSTINLHYYNKACIHGVDQIPEVGKKYLAQGFTLHGLVRGQLGRGHRPLGRLEGGDRTRVPRACSAEARLEDFKDSDA